MTPNQLHGLESFGFHEFNTSEELFRLFFHVRRAWPCSSIEKQQEKRRKIVEKSKEMEKILGESEGLLREAGIAERRKQMICFGIVEGGTPCFVYRRKARRRSGSKNNFFILLLLLVSYLFK